MKYPRLIVSLALAGTLASGVTFAQSSPQPQQAPHPQAEASGQSTPGSTEAPAANPGGAPSFADLDTKGKGYIQRSDVPKDNDALKELRAHFNEADADHNGRVTAAEYNAYVSKASARPQN